MKSFRLKIRPSFLIFISMLGYVGYFVGCTQKDQILTTGPAIPENTTNLVSMKATTAPTIDGAIDQTWDKAAKLTVAPTVPDPGNGLFAGYIGEQYSGTLRSMYDDQNIYFLLEITDPTQSTMAAPWYFNPTLNVTGKTGWQKEPSSRTFDINGVMTRDGFGEDKFAMLWNVDNSTPKFITQTCYSSCHVFTPYLDYSKNPAVMNANASGNHYTNGQNEKIDMWWGRLGYISRDPSLNFLDDNYQDWAGGPTYSDVTGGNSNGRHVDGIYPNGTFSSTWPGRPSYSTSPNQGEFSNSQNLKLDGNGASVAVPIWVVPGAPATGFIMLADTVSGVAKKVKGVSSAGVLTLNDNSTIDPTASADYQRTGDAVTGATAANAIPSLIAIPLVSERADITCSAVYSGSGWVVEYKRALKTGDVLKQDIDFSSLSDQPFGVAVWNKSNNQHGIQPNLLLQFQK